MPINEYTAKYEQQLITQKACFEKHLNAGVIFISDYGVFIDDEVIIEAGATILPGSILKGSTKILTGSVIGPNSLLENVTVGKDVTFNSSQAYNCVIKAGEGIGPFCHIRPGSVIGARVHLGDFVEIKNSNIGEATSISHLTYVGDSDVGKGCNFGCGISVANYDGGNKNRCTVGDFAFIGCNTSLVSPVNIGSGAYIGAGSTIVNDVPTGALGISRAQQNIKPEWASEKLKPYIEKQKAKIKTDANT